MLVRVTVIAAAALGIHAAAGCNSAGYSDPGPCTGSSCTCEQDPTLPRCKGFNDRPETGADLPDGAFTFDAGSTDATDAADLDTGVEDAADDAG